MSLAAAVHPRGFVAGAGQADLLQQPLHFSLWVENAAEVGEERQMRRRCTGMVCEGFLNWLSSIKKVSPTYFSN